MILCSVILLLPCLVQSRGLHRRQDVEFEGIKPLAVMVRSGDNVTLHCGSDQDQDWFFCLWRHPAGGKECSVQVGKS